MLSLWHGVFRRNLGTSGEGGRAGKKGEEGGREDKKEKNCNCCFYQKKLSDLAGAFQGKEQPR